MTKKKKSEKKIITWNSFVQVLHSGPLSLPRHTPYVTEGSGQSMDLADIDSLWELVGALWDCLGWEASSWEKLGVANNLLDFFLQKTGSSSHVTGHLADHRRLQVPRRRMSGRPTTLHQTTEITTCARFFLILI